MKDKQNKDKQNKDKQKKVKSCCTHTKKDKQCIRTKDKRFLIYQDDSIEKYVYLVT